MIAAALDWGSSSLRAYRFDEAGQCVQTDARDAGIKFVSEDGFEDVFRELTSPWTRTGDRVLLSGMITSRNGWIESDYLPCPLPLTQLLDAGTRLALDGLDLVFLPGARQDAPADVMRGEELQLLGASSIYGDGVYITPGTHSKWARITSGVLEQFRTIPTGEVFDVLIKHSLIGALTSDGNWDEAAFLAGVERGNQLDSVLSDLFTTRSGVLLQQYSEAFAYAWLSGLLIGREIREGLATLGDQGARLTLIGSAPLCANYLKALSYLQLDAHAAEHDVTLSGYQQIIAHVTT